MSNQSSSSTSVCVNSKQDHGFEIIDGLLTCAEYIESLNYNERPANTEIDLLIIHCASLPHGEYDNDNLQKLFSGRLSPEKLVECGQPADLRVSVHLYITRSGKIYQFVPFHKRAWHAGLSEFDGKVDCNHFSIGIELQGTVETEFTQEQYSTLINITNTLMRLYPGITKSRIVGHSDVAPERKSDPGKKFKWESYLGSLS